MELFITIYKILSLIITIVVIILYRKRIREKKKVGPLIKIMYNLIFIQICFCLWFFYYLLAFVNLILFIWYLQLYNKFKVYDEER